MKLTSLSLLAAVLALVALSTGARAHDVRPGETVRGEVAGASAVEVLDLDLAAGDSVKITLKARGGIGCAPAVEILDPHGQVVASAANERKMKIALVAAETGTYGIRLTSDAATAPRFSMKVRGDERRSYADRDGALALGLRAGSSVSIKIKAKEDCAMELRAAAGGALLAEAEGGRKLKASVASAPATADYELAYAPEDARAKVKVAYPAPRGAIDIVLESPAGLDGSYSPPAAEADEEQDGEPAEDPDDGSEDANDGAAAGDATANAGDGTVGGNPDGTASAPAAITDHAYLTDLLERRPSAELERMRMDLGRLAGRPVAEVWDALAAAAEDAIVLRIRDAVADRWEEAADAELIGAMMDVLEAQRRADRAQRGLDLLAQEIPMTALAGDLAYDAGQAMLAAGLTALRDGIEAALAAGLRSDEAAVVDGEQVEDGAEAPAAAPGYDAPPAAPATPEVLAGHAALDAALLSGTIMSRARAGEPAAIELAEVFYEGYAERLQADGTAPAALQAVQMAQADLRALREQVFGIEFEIALVADPRPARDEAYDLVIAVFGPTSGVEFMIEGAEADGMENDGAQCRIRMPGSAEPQDLVVRAHYLGEERAIAIHVDPGQDEEPAMAELVGRIVNEAAEPVAAAQWELRTVAGELARNADGQAVAGDTDAEGFFAASHVLAGEYELVIHVAGQDEVSVPVTVAEEDPTDLGEIILH